MKSIHFLFCSVILFYFSEGKPCPEDTRPHKTRCDSYFKCVTLSSKNKHVWIPVKCDIGLIYERNLKTCVLPEDDWECNNEEIQNNDKDNKFEIYPAPKRKPNKKLNKIQMEILKINPLQNQNYHVNINNNSSSSSSRSDYLNGIKSSGETKTHYKDSEIEFENFMKSENDFNKVNEDYESSGDGLMDKDEYEIEMKESESSNIDMPDSSLLTSKIDTNLVKHLQRLSQLIDGLKQKYHGSDNNTISSGDLRPDQLNAFLAHFNIKSEFDSIQPNTEKIQVPEDGKIQPDILKHVLKQQQKLSMDTIPIDKNSPLIFKKPMKGNHNMNSVMKMDCNKNKNNYNPTLKDLRVPAYNNFDDESSISINLVENQRNDPEIPEDTLQTVIKLSKEMASNENTRQVIKVNGIFQPLLHQSYYGSLASGLFHRNPYRRHDTEHFYEIITDEDYKSCNHKAHIPNQYGDGENDWSFQSTTIKPQFNYFNRQNEIDSYGNKVSDYIEYPPYKNNQNFVSTTTTPSPSSSSSLVDQIQREVEISNIFTPSPHLDNTNINKIVEIDNFPTIPYVYPANRIKSPMEYKLSQQKQVDSMYPSHSYDKLFNKNQLPPYRHQHHHHHHYPVYPNLFQVNPETVTIEPNSYKKPSSEEQIDPIYSDNVQQITNTNKNPMIMNKQKIVNELLATATTSSLSNSDQIFPHVQNSFSTVNKINKNNVNNNDQQLINLAGHFINYDLFKNHILPSIVQNENNDITSLNNFAYNFEIVSCNSGVRQPNSTDCTKYYVCSKKDGRILSYSCPPYTAFNAQTRICDAQTFKICNPNSLLLSDTNNYHLTLSENRKIQLEAIRALQEAKRIREEVIKAQNLANLIRLQAEKINEENYKNQQLLKPLLDDKFDDTVPDQLNESNESTLTKPTDLMVQQHNENHQYQLQKQQQQLHKQQQHKQQQKRIYYCKEGAKIPDQLSVFNYYVCYKTKDGIMHGHKMKCSSGLIFCAKSSMCTLPKRCNTT